jgi:hypothetical protein
MHHLSRLTFIELTCSRARKVVGGLQCASVPNTTASQRRAIRIALRITVETAATAIVRSFALKDAITDQELLPFFWLHRLHRLLREDEKTVNW